MSKQSRHYRQFYRDLRRSTACTRGHCRCGGDHNWLSGDETEPGCSGCAAPMKCKPLRDCDQQQQQQQ